MTREDSQLFAASLFSGAGIGDVGIQAAGFSLRLMSEREPDRAALARRNFPEALHVTGDIWQRKGEIVEALRSDLVGGQGLFLLVCTAPCQGMSKSGQGTLLANVRKGNRPKLDLRNRLILPALEIIAAVRPMWVVFENVVEMRNTVIEDAGGQLRPILDVVRSVLAPDYVGEAYDIEFADYGVPQRRQRLITVYTRDPMARDRYAVGASLVPAPTHSKRPIVGRLPWVSVSVALAQFPPLDGRDAESARTPELPFHRVPVLDAKKYEWIRHTPLGGSAFDNQCVNPNCGFAGNPTHGASHGVDGINRAHKHTPLFCERCGQLLPRPYALDENGSKRIMSGFTSAYKRMDPDLPAPALTRNLSYPCSDHKIHPTQNRVLSLAEAIHLQTLGAFSYAWGPLEYQSESRRVSRKIAPDALVRLVLGESVPPEFMKLLGRHIQRLSATAPLPVAAFSDSGRTQLALL